MTLNEAGQIILAINLLWGGDKDMTEGKAEVTVRLWYDTFLKDYEYKEVLDAVKDMARTYKWRPSVSEIIDVVEEKANPNMPSIAEAYEHIRKLVSYYGRTYKKSAEAEMSEIELGAVKVVGWDVLCNTTDKNRKLVFTTFSEAYLTELKKYMREKRVRMSQNKALNQQTVNEPHELPNGQIKRFGEPTDAVKNVGATTKSLEGGKSM